MNLAYRAFGTSRTCYRYKARLDEENGVIADWLVAAGLRTLSACFH
jgi:putative transposase